MFVQGKGKSPEFKRFFVLLSSFGSRRISDKSRTGFYDGKWLKQWRTSWWQEYSEFNIILYCCSLSRAPAVWKEKNKSGFVMSFISKRSKFVMLV